MRRELQKVDGTRGKFIGTFVRYGKANRTTITLLFENIADEQGNILTDHLWFRLTEVFKRIGGILAGEKVEFEARVKDYRKGMGHDVIDHKLAWPSKVRLLEEREYIRLSSLL